MKAVLLAGGFGKRLLPFTKDIPKPMIKVAGKPLLEHTINYFRKYNIREFIISLYYLSEKITQYFGDGSKFGVDIRYIFEKRPLGTAGAVKLAEKYLSEPFIVSYADVIRNTPLDRMINSYKQRNPTLSIAVYKNYSISFKSSVIFDKNYNIIGFEEKRRKRGNLIEYVWSNASLYICNPKIFSYIPEAIQQDFASNIFPQIISKELFLAFPYDGYCFDIGRAEKLKQLRSKFNIYFPKGG